MPPNDSRRALGRSQGRDHSSTVILYRFLSKFVNFSQTFHRSLVHMFFLPRSSQHARIPTPVRFVRYFENPSKLIFSGSGLLVCIPQLPSIFGLVLRAKTRNPSVDV